MLLLVCTLPPRFSVKTMESLLRSATQHWQSSSDALQPQRFAHGALGQAVSAADKQTSEAPSNTAVCARTSTISSLAVQAGKSLNSDQDDFLLSI